MSAPPTPPRERSRRRSVGRALTAPARVARRGAGLLARPRTWDVLLLLVGGVLLVVTWSTVARTHEVSNAVAPAFALLAVAPLALVRRQPEPAWLVAVGVDVHFWLFTDPRAPHELPWTVPHLLVLFATLIGVALLGRLPLVPVALVGSGLLVAVAGPAWAVTGLLVGLSVTTVLALLVRWLVISRRQLARQAEATEVERSRRAVLEERSRIARDLHDVVAHRMSLVVVQAQSAPARLGGVDPQVAAEFRSISEQAREALNEVRGMLGVLRSEDADVRSTPQEGAADAEELLRRTRAAGVDLHWRSTGDPDLVGPAVGMVVHRILQEALANATRHSPGSRVEVTLDFGDPVAVEVLSRPGSAPAPAYDASATPAGSGTGIAGMRDRAHSVGGALEAGPSAAGFLVRARLPATAPTRL